MKDALIQAIGTFTQATQNWAAEEQTLRALSDNLDNQLATLMDAAEADLRFSGKTGLEQLTREVNNLIRHALKAQRQAWEHAAPVRELCRTYENRIVILVFGKVNAGKSTLINFLADQLAPTLGAPRYFMLENGEQKIIPGPLTSGVTETTSAIQGVELGESLVLIDTPGLHSVTEENAKLAQLFTDAGDAVLWLTSSTAPAPVQELDALRREMARGRPLIPVIIASDWLVEDVDAEGNIIRMWCNKTPDVRKAQEEDVFQRARAKLDKQDRALLRQPLSVSVFMCRQDGCTPQAFRDSGMGSLLDSLATIVGEAQAYKCRKARSQIVNHLEEQVIMPLRTHVLPKLNQITQRSRQERESLFTQRRIMEAQLVAELRVRALTIIAAHKDDKDVAAISAEISQVMTQMANDAIQKALSDYTRDLGVLLSGMIPALDAESLGTFHEKIEEWTEVRYAWAGAAGSGIGALAGGFLGSSLGPAGTAVGATVGGMVGRFMGNKMKQHHIRHIVTEVDSGEVEARASEWVTKQGEKLIRDIMSVLDEELERVARIARDAGQHIEDFAQHVTRMKEEIRA